MARRKTAARLYWRDQGGARRAYADFRDYADVGGKREPLIARGEKRATTDQDIAQTLITERLKKLEARRRGRAVLGVTKVASLAAFATEHLMAKRRAGRTTESWLCHVQLHLERACAYFGSERDLASIGVADVRAWVTHLQTQPSGRGKTEELPHGRASSGGNVRHHLVALSNLYRRAGGEGYVPPGYNPVAALMEKPTAGRLEARWLEVPDAALVLEAARTLPPRGGTKLSTAAVAQIRAEWTARDTRNGSADAGPRLSKRALAKAYGVSDVVIGRILRGQDAREPDDVAGFLYPLLAVFLLTGGRRAEVLGLELDDVSFARKTVTFRPNRWRRLKTSTSARVVPLWPQLESILRAYLVARGEDAPHGLLFPAWDGGAGSNDGGERMIADIDGLLDTLAEHAGWKAGEIRSKMFRHTYCAARLQTLDQGAPVSIYTVARELGHGGDALVKRVYGHLGTVRHRADIVEYRVEQHIERLGKRLTALQALETACQG